MIYIINNNTTHSYSRYSTRPNRIYKALLKTKLSIRNPTHYDAIGFEFLGNPLQKQKANRQSLFQTKQLLCWGPDLAFFNLRSTFSNILKALQICWSAVRNNKKILFVNGNNSIDAGSVLVSTWLTQQYKRDGMPRKLSNISKELIKYTNYSAVSSKHSTNSLRLNNLLFNNLNSFLNSCSVKMPLVPNTHQGVIKNPTSLFNSVAIKSKVFYLENYTLLSEKSQNQCLQDPHQPKTKQRVLDSMPALKLGPSKIIKPQLKCTTEMSEARNENKLIANSTNQLKLKTINAIKLQVKEAQTLTQQAATGITAPLVGFLTNTKTGFNISQNLLNQDFYDQCRSINFKNTPNELFKNPVHVYTKPVDQPNTSNIVTTKENSKKAGIGIQSYWGTEIYSQYYLPFSFYTRPIFSRYIDLALNPSPSKNKGPIDNKIKQHTLKQNLFGNVLAWRLKGQHPSSIFYSKFKIFDQRNKHKLKQGVVADKSNTGIIVNQLTLVSTKPPRLLKHTVDFFRLKKQAISSTNNISLKFYSNFKPSNVYSGTINKRTVLECFSPLKHDRYSTALPFKKPKNNTIHKFYIKRFYQNVNNSSIYKQKQKYIQSNVFTPRITPFINKEIIKFYKSRKQMLSKNNKWGNNQKKFRNYYNKFVISNQFKQYQMFAKSPYINNKLADIIFFINPEKNKNLVSQANCLKIPTIGVISGITNSGLGRRSCNHYSLNNLVNYPILGNPSSNFFIYTVIGVFIKTLRSS